jgi:hypothetical protein
MRIILLTAVGSLAMSVGMAQSSIPAGREIHRLFLADQSDRGEGHAYRNPKNVTVSPEQMVTNDAGRRKRVHEMLDQGILKTGADFHDAAFIFQHGDTPEDYLLAHVLAMAAIAQGDARGRWIAAATLDRYLQAVGEPQIFGTQYAQRGFFEFMRQERAARQAQDIKPSSQAPGPTAVTSVSNEGGKSAAADASKPSDKPDEFVQEPYNSTLISASLRAQYCVVAIEQQKKNVSSLNAGRGFEKRLLPGCKE